MPLAVMGRLDGDRCVRDPGALDTGEDPSPRFTVAELGAEEADDVDAIGSAIQRTGPGVHHPLAS
jgi:hypothetical protein